MSFSSPYGRSRVALSRSDWRALGDAPGDIVAGPSSLNAGQQVITYLLLLPLIVFSVHGGFSFEHGSWNSELGATGHGIALAASASETLHERAQSWVVLVVCIVAMAPYARLIVEKCGAMPTMLLLSFYAIGSAAWSQDPAASLRSGGYLLFAMLFAFYLTVRFSGRQQMQLVMLTGGVVAVLCVFAALLFPQYGVDHQVHEGVWQGIFTQKNVCAQSLTFLLTPAFALPCRGRYAPVIRALYLSLALLVIVMTQSRTAWAIALGYVAFIAGLRLLARFERSDLIALAAIAFAAATTAFVTAIKFLPELLAFSSRSSNFSGRAEIWSAVMASILKRPVLGYGFDAFWSTLQGEATNVFAATGWIVTGAHCGYLNVGLELGCVGAVLLAITFLQAGRDALKCLRSQRSPYIEWCIGIVFLTLVYNLDERTLMATQYLPWMLYIVACAGLAGEARKMRSAATPAAGLEPGK